MRPHPVLDVVVLRADVDVLWLAAYGASFRRFRVGRETPSVLCALGSRRREELGTVLELVELATFALVLISAWRLVVMRSAIEAVLKLRAVRTSNDWAEDWSFHLDRERRRVHQTRYADGVLPRALDVALREPHPIQ
ncbi:MAG: hypothetical protein M0Z69_00235 [Actinomycetota bacterium]|nr:hypothetical protein [Actinomycetota bacterium]